MALILALTASKSASAALSFDIAYIDDAGGTLASRGWLDPESTFQRNIAAAAKVWGAQFDSDETIVMRVDTTSFGARAGGTNTLGRLLYVNDDGKEVWEYGPLTRILTGDNPGEDFYGYDVVLGFDAAFVEEFYWFDPQPELRITTVPGDKNDFMSVALHELGHALGMTGNRDFDTGEIFGNVATQFDDLSYFGGDGAPFDGDGNPNPLFFGGAEATSLYGGPLPLTHKPPSEPLWSQNYYHLSAADPGAPDGLESTLMSGDYLPLGERLFITPFERAILADEGYPLAVLDSADFNVDGAVDALDFTVWVAKFSAGPGADADSDGDSDGEDFLAWQQQFNAGATATSVPEPATIAHVRLALLAAIVGFNTRRRRA